MNPVIDINLKENIIKNLQTWYKSQKNYTQKNLGC